MKRNVQFAAIQQSFSWNEQDNIEKLTNNIKSAAQKGTQVILMSELPLAHYFCKQQNYDYLKLAVPAKNHPFILEMQKLAKELNVVLPVSFYELDGNETYNSLVMIDADGKNLGIYRKSHIPDGPGYQEKFYFKPGNSGFKVWDTAYGRFGAAICWDQWFPEPARIMALNGAEALFYPTAIGSEPQDATLDSRDHWQRAMQGHGASNLMPIIAANRVGVEVDDGIETTFYGSSFITDGKGAKIAEASRSDEEIITATIDLHEAAYVRKCWGVFRDRRPSLYGDLLK